jgi:hypothetical protein
MLPLINEIWPKKFGRVFIFEHRVSCMLKQTLCHVSYGPIQFCILLTRQDMVSFASADLELRILLPPHPGSSDYRYVSPYPDWKGLKRQIPIM